MYAIRPIPNFFKLIIANIQRHAHSHTHILCGNSRISGKKSFSRYFFKTSLKFCRVRLLLASTVWPIVQSEMRASAQHIHYTFFIFLFHKKVHGYHHYSRHHRHCLRQQRRYTLSLSDRQPR